MEATAPNPTDPTKVTAFIERWRPGGGSGLPEAQPETGKQGTEQPAWPAKPHAAEEILSALQGRNSAKRKKEVREILETLEVLGWG